VRWLREDAIRPWQYRSWIFPTDPDFAEKAGRILDLYEGRWEGKLLHPGDCIISADEKPSIQIHLAALLPHRETFLARSRQVRGAGIARTDGACLLGMRSARRAFRHRGAVADEPLRSAIAIRVRLAYALARAANSASWPSSLAPAIGPVRA
jgi:hypothetical protein